MVEKSQSFNVLRDHVRLSHITYPEWIKHKLENDERHVCECSHSSRSWLFWAKYVCSQTYYQDKRHVCLSQLELCPGCQYKANIDKRNSVPFAKLILRLEKGINVQTGGMGQTSAVIANIEIYMGSIYG